MYNHSHRLNLPNYYGGAFSVCWNRVGAPCLCTYFGTDLVSLTSHRYNIDNLFLPITDACTILAQAISCLQQTPDRRPLAHRSGHDPSWEEIMELVFFLFIFLLQSILRLCHARAELAPGANVLKLHIMVMSVFIQWIDRTANEAVALSSIMGDMQITELRLAVHAPFLAYVLKNALLLCMF